MHVLSSWSTAGARKQACYDSDMINSCIHRGDSSPSIKQPLLALESLYINIQKYAEHEILIDASFYSLPRPCVARARDQANLHVPVNIWL